MVSTAEKTIKPRARKNKKNSEVAKISIAESAEKLGVTEEFINASVQAIYPKGTTEITLNEFQAIAEALQSKLREPQSDENLATDSPSPEQAPENLNHEIQPELISDSPADLIIDEESDLMRSESDELLEQQEQINLGVANSLDFIKDYAITVDKITSALAYVSAKKAASNFIEIHSAVFQNELENYLDDFAAKVSSAVKHINQSSAAKDFLEQKGIFPKCRRTVEEILD